MKTPFLPVLLAASCFLPVALAHAQQQTPGTPQTPPASPTTPPATPGEKTVSLDAHDAPVRQVLTQLFDNVKVDYALDNAVNGFVTLKVTDQPFENVLRLILRSASVPLTYTRTNNVYEIKPRLVQTVANLAPAVTSEEPAAVAPSSGPHYAVIQLTYLDPWDVRALLGITLVPSGSRGGGGGNGSGSPLGGSPSGNSGGLGFGSGGGVGTVGGNGTGGRIIGGGNGSGVGNRPGR